MPPAGRYLLDTNILIALLAADATVQAEVTKASAVFVPSVALGELFYGAQKSGRPMQNTQAVEALAAAAAVLPCGTDTAAPPTSQPALLPLGRVCPRMHRLQPSYREVSIPCRSGEIGVAQDLLHIPDVRPALEQQGGHGVPEQMAAAGLAEARLRHVAGHSLREPIEPERRAPARQKQPPGVGIAYQAGSAPPQITGKPPQRPPAHRYHPIPLTLAGSDNQDPALHLDVGQSQAGRLRPAEPGRVEEFQQGPVPEAERRAGVSLVQYPLHLAGAQDGARQLDRPPGQYQLRRRITAQEPPNHAPAEKTPERAEVLGPGSPAERAAVRSGCPTQSRLVRLEVPARQRRQLDSR